MIGDRIQLVGGTVEVADRYGIPGENDCSEWLYGICASIGMSVANTYFRHMGVHKWL